MRLSRGRAAQQMLPHLTVGQSHFLPEMVILARLLGLRMIEIPLNYCARPGSFKITGSTVMALRVGTRTILLILRYRLLAWLTGADRYQVRAKP
jgi:hypothetical protein